MKILFISHDGSRTGAPLLLLRLLEKLKLAGGVEIMILLKDEGELTAAFKAVGPTFIWNVRFNEGLLNNLKYKLGGILHVPIANKQQKHQAYIFDAVRAADIIFNNTVANASLLQQLPLQGKRVFSYFHELQVVTAMMAPGDAMGYLSTISEHIFVPSLAVKAFLHNEYTIADNKISQLKYIIPVPKNQTLKQASPRLFTVGLCGTLHWRKGYEFLPLIIQKIVIKYGITDIQFNWIGANQQGMEYAILQADLEKMGIQNQVNFIPPALDISASLAEIDVMLLLSREDAFPLVVLEAAHHSVPCIYFTKSGGIGEFLENDAGVPVEYLDLDTVCSEIITMKNDPERCMQMGKRAKQKVMEYSDDQQTVETLLKYFNQPSRQD